MPMGLRMELASTKPPTQESVVAPTAAVAEKLLEQQGDRTRRKMLLRSCGCLAGLLSAFAPPAALPGHRRFARWSVL